jgi:serine/threonine protein kinase
VVSVRAGRDESQFAWGLERFVEEARALASFRHPNIVRVLRYFRENGTAYIVMEYESGDPLKRWLGRQHGLDQHGLLQIAYPLLSGLEAVHKLQFLHRDIKPDNIYIRADGTPVLLDFGAARRVSGDQDLTNIVSPGFAAFEQYHSKGHQGPWTDLYSLGAVLYWMTTGTKPQESAARVRDDNMPKAVDLASRAAYGEQLLQAIDWALTPNEALRPQNVAQLRAALEQSEHVRTQVPETELLSLSRRLGMAGPPSPSKPTPTPGTTSLALRKNVMGTIMFLDLVAYSTLSVDQQVIVKTLFNELITKALGGVDPESRIMLDTGDGAAICFLGDPEEALRSALLMRDLLLQKHGHKLSMRVGLHMGPLRLLPDINNRVNVVGDGINVAQRIMDFSGANQIMLSRAFYDVISRISDGAESMFQYLGPRLDKHQRSHEIYALVDSQAIREPALATPESFAPTRLVEDVQHISPEDLQAIESDLALAIGPLAHVLFRKSATRVGSAHDLRELLSVSIQDPVAREQFIYPKPPPAYRNSTSAPLSAALRSMPFSRPLSRPANPSQNQSHHPSVSQPLSNPSGTSHASGSHSVPGGAGPLSAEAQAFLEQALSQYIGPLARTLVRKEAARTHDSNVLLEALAQHIDQSSDRKKFLAAAAKWPH